ncbi:MAG: TRAP transporter small permease [Paracoccaceae bacterium]|nr:TRAP transporter small permease [Paracoccaceae bacterium]MDG1373407.1 TRAP transporter small permease [Paracoccaceae bacterium]
MNYEPKSSLARAVNALEETAIALMLGLMTLITFSNVVARYVFNSNILWQLEATVFLFAWLVLFGVSYSVKITAHLGVDVVINTLNPSARRAVGLLSVAICLTFSLLMLKGGWDYWWKFADKASFLEVNDIPMPGFLQFLADITNDGEPYEKIPRYIPYLILPVGMTLLTFRFAQAGLKIILGETDRVIASHEAEDAVEEVAARRASEDTEAPGADFGEDNHMASDDAHKEGR